MSKPIQPKGEVKPSIENDVRRLARLRGLPQPAIRAAMDEGVLTFGKQQGLPAWFYRDEHAGSVRRLDGEPWESRSKAKAWDVEGTSGEKLTHWPVGILSAQDKRLIVVCEGAPDALAAYAVREQTQGNFAIVGMLGAKLTIHEKALPQFAGKRIRFIAHADPDGREFAERNARLLVGKAEEVSIATLDGIRRADGNAAGDLCEAVEFRRLGDVPDEVAQLFDFNGGPPRVRFVTIESGISAPPPSQKEFVTQDDPRITHGEPKRTHKMGEGKCIGSVQELHDRARELASTARGQSRKQLFALARVVLGFENCRSGKDGALRDSVFETWFAASQGNLDPKEKRPDYLARFRAVFRKVRIVPGRRDSLREAEERARVSTLPDIPDAPDASEGWRVLAAVCRELQRAAGNAPFFIGMRDASRIAIGFPHPMQGSRILDALIEFGVIQRTKLGLASRGGKASEYRYLLPC